MTSTSQGVPRAALRALTLLAFAGVIGGGLVFQQQREVVAEQSFQLARDQAMVELSHAQQLGLAGQGVSDLENLVASVSGRQPPKAPALLNQSRIDFFLSSRDQELQIVDELQGREQKLFGQTQAAAAEAVGRLAAGLARAEELGVDAKVLAPMTTLLAATTNRMAAGPSLTDLREMAADLETPIGTVSLLIADQESVNGLIGPFLTQAALQDQGDPALAQTNAQAALAQARADLLTAGLFRMDVTLEDAQIQGLAAELAAASNITQVERVTGWLTLRDRVLQQAMAAALPEKAITISLAEQKLRALEHGQEVFSTLITTGRPFLETVTGTFRVYWKVTPWVMHSPWPQGSPNWYPDSKVKMVMWYDGAYGIHDAWWRAIYGPGTNLWHYDPLGADTGTHGCVNVPYSNMVWLWNWTPTGTPVIVY